MGGKSYGDVEILSKNKAYSTFVGHINQSYINTRDDATNILLSIYRPCFRH